MEAVEPEVLADDPELLDKGLDRPQRRVVREVGLSTAELVVEDRPPAGLGHPLEGLEVVVGGARATVKQEQRQLPLLLSVADDPVPGLVAAERDVPFGAVHGSSRGRVAYSLTRRAINDGPASSGTGCDGPDVSCGFALAAAAAGVCSVETWTRSSVSLSTLSGWWQAARWPLP